MDVRDGFIVGIFNYCDRRCESCAFTSRCRLFATSARLEAMLDPALRELTEAPNLAGEGAPPVPRALLELIDALDDADMDDDAWQATEQGDAHRPPAAHDALRARAEAHRERVWAWLHVQPDPRRDLAAAAAPAPPSRDDPIAIVVWAHLFIPCKLAGLLGMVESTASWHEYAAEAAHRSDVASGAAKVVLLAVERAHAAWLRLADTGSASATHANACIADLIWMHDALECLFPHARAFVRPAFDEPEQVAQLEAAEFGRPDPAAGASET
jgi:hypothetical protein